ncbi:MAG: hypothetical protein WAT91_00290 [Saprospiraceae bacterium]
MVIQHIDLANQEKYIPSFQKLVEEGELLAMDLAYLKNRILMRQEKKRDQEFYPIEDEKNLNIRRKNVGLED